MARGPIRIFEAGVKSVSTLYAIYAVQGTLFLVSCKVLNVLILDRGWFVSGAERSLNLLKDPVWTGDGWIW